MKIAMGSTVSARYLREKPADRDAPWRVLKGGIGVNAAAPQPDAGLFANLNLKSLDIDVWRTIFSDIAGNETRAASGAKPASDLGFDQYIAPDVLAVRATEMIVMGKKLNNVVVGASHQQNTWQANIDSEQASGYITWRESTSGRGLGRVTARLASLIIPQSAANEVSQLLEATSKAAPQFPALDVVAEDFQLFGKRLGQLEINANNASGQSGREWRINKLSIANPDASFKAAGKWLAGSTNTTSLTYALDVTDAGKLLTRFGFANVLRGGKGRMDGDMSWKGVPFSLDLPTLSGQLTLDIAAGQFLKVDPGAAKLLGVLSLQSLPRRLTLDFRDVFSEGFAFDSIVSTATIAQGMLTTDSFKMRGVNAVVLMNGSVDIAEESQNLHVVVIPEINAGAASLVYGLAVNPVIGLGSFMAQLFLRDPLMKAFTSEYQITGPWKDPAVNKLPRNLGSAGRRDAEVSGTRLEEMVSG
jgi:uncharacterized protein YhdP